MDYHLFYSREECDRILCLVRSRYGKIPRYDIVQMDTGGTKVQSHCVNFDN